MYRCILVPLDGTAFGEAALPYAIAIARRSGALLQLAHVHLPPIVPSGAETAALPPVWMEMSWEEKRGYVERIASAAAARGVRVETRVMEGGVVPALEQHAVNCAAGLIVMSTHGNVGLSRLWHHGVADQLARDLPLPIVLVRPPAEEPSVEPVEAPEPELRNILVPLDGSPEAELVIEPATALGRGFGARYTLLRVVGTSADASEEGAAPLQEHTAARQYLNAIAERLRSRSLEVTTEVVAGGDAATAILEHVHRVHEQGPRHVDLIAVESPERGTVTRLLFRGTADALLREAPVPLLLQRGRRAEPVPTVVAQVGLAGSA